ncbi:ATP-binding cassette domain-containing protein [Solwaraspora sp. WMMD406]|uniref:ATP-binding cassette domain-containing protein n=1 Tax=Solwaraspora sp. WMMD406 TaxID=3016095 RepID=UPI0024180F30|nr:ATP-binding cassette domain-containing protein [Solwaraspora sp. WMMD406]MDG4764389.1 ATP-binding cassette domain-containing protein [Solwaraspora sp. WMMD406]
MQEGVFTEDLRKRFGDFRALDGVDLVAPAGTIGSILGPNGAGKTTTIRILATLTTADSGRAFVGGHDVHARPHMVRSIIALTGQFAAIDGGLSARENLILIARLHRQPRRLAKAKADELLERFELTPAAHQHARTFSGGMRRRLDLAMSLITSPQVLFLDEPTTGLDPPSRERLWEVVEDLRDNGTCVILTTQYLEEADRLADKITVINHGRTVAVGTPPELKLAYGGEIVEVHAAGDADAHRAAKSLAVTAGLDDSAVAVNVGSARARFRVQSGTFTVAAAVRALDAEGLNFIDITVHRATLDEVFDVVTAAEHP